MIGYITLLQVTSLIADDYDTSATCLQQSPVQPLDRSIEALLAGFTKWDAVYFLRISEVCAGLGKHLKPTLSAETEPNTDSY
jgi:hypothetical protein